ncbi:MAG TPA: hypothetical protein HPP94_12870 [Desulfuromonadales bacterium]|nr:hypothetical protein [Desulfuromonadales bacterium]
MNNPIQQRIHAETVKKVAQQFLGMQQFSLFGIFMVALFFLGAGWLPDAGTNLLLPGGNRASGIWQLLGSVLTFSAFGLVIRHKIKEKQHVRVVSEVPPSARVLILFLSSLSEKQIQIFNEASGSGGVSADMIAGTSWEMPYLAIKHHAERLEQVHVFTSSGSRGSHQHFACFREIMSALFSGIRIVELNNLGIDFEDIETVHDHLDKLYEQFDTTDSFGPHDVMLDVTGGQKTNSIAGAMATLSEGRKFQYVSTNNKEKVLSYDMVIEIAPGR